jgi:release factor glutamine methyltransferase
VPEPAVAVLRVGDAVARGVRRLADAGCDSPRLDAELLLGSVLGVGRERLVLDRDVALRADAVARFGELLARREAREPIAYIVGVREFRRLSLHVDRRVLIPRPETELLVEVGLGLGSGARVADVGTGSGAVALALKDERPDLRVWGFDLSADAVAVARGNAERLGLDVAFECRDLLGAGAGAGAVAGNGAGEWDAVLANLPYVAVGSPLAPEISSYEPARALFAGADGLEVIRRLVAAVGGRAGLVALEIDPRQAAAVRELVGGAFGHVRVLGDLAGHERVVVGSA